MVQRAVKMLARGETIEFDEDRFAALFGVGARHLRRVFVDEIGKTPKQLAFENRLTLARKLMVETALPITEIAFAAGFASIRRFNDAFKLRFKKSPREIRRLKIPEGSALRLSLAYRPPFDFDGLMTFYRNHRNGNLEWFEGDTLYRLFAFDGKVGTVAISNDPSNASIIVAIDFPDTAFLPRIISRVRKMFDLDSDPLVVANSLELDRKVGALLSKRPGVRLPSGWDEFEVAVGILLGQVVSVERGRALVGDLIELCGRDSGREREGRTIKLFPTPDEVAGADLTALKTTTIRKQSLIEFARAVADKTLSLEPTQDVDEFIKKVTAIRGIGPWSANYMALKVLRHTDAFPDTDLILARVLAIHPKKVIDQMSPWRGYAAALFWLEYAQTLKKANLVAKLSSTSIHD